jgi:hypothetical protein
MKTIYDYIKEASILGDIDDVLSDGDEYAQKKEIAEWLNDNFDFVRYDNYDDVSNNPNKISLNNKDEINLQVFRPYYNYAEKQNKFLDLPIPDYIKIDNVTNFDIVGNLADIKKIDMGKLPHINSCNTLFLRNWDSRTAWNADLSILNNIDEISHLIIDIEGVHPVKWPKSIISCVNISSTAGVISYDDEYLEKQGLDYNLHNFAGLTTMELIIPEYFITENMNLISTRSKSDITINENDLPYEWKNLDLIFSTKSFDKLYVFKPLTWDKFYEVKKIGKSFIIKHRSTNLMKKYQF